jgi:hypothetical protein
MAAEGNLLYRTCLLGCLLGAVATLVFLFGWAGALLHPVSNFAAATSAVLAAAYFLYVFIVVMPRGESRLGFGLWGLSAGVLGVQAALGLLPPTARDELTHHLALPRLYAEAGRILELPFAPYSYYPMLLDMLYVPWVWWGWDSFPKLIHGLYGSLTGLLVYVYLASRLSAIYGLLGFFILVFTPANLRLGHWAYVDLGVTFYTTAALLCIVRRTDGRSWLVLAGFCAGFAVTSKPNGLLALFLVFLLLLLVLVREAERGGKMLATEAGLFLLPALLPALPWWLRNFSWTGNPLFPFFASLFGGGGGEGGGGGPGLGIFNNRELLYGESGWQILALPLRVFFAGQDDQPQYFDGVLNPVLVLFLPWAFKGKWRGEKKLFFAFALLYFLYALFLTDLRVRYILPIIPPLVILLVYAVHNIYLRVVRPSLLFAGLAVLLALNGSYLANHLRAVSPLGYLSGGESRDAYLSRMLPEYPAIKYINQNLHPAAKIYFLFIGRRVYYCERDYFHDSGEYPAFFLGLVRSAQRGRDVAAGLEQKGITHLFLRVDLFLKFLSVNFNSRDAEIWHQFQTGHLAPLRIREGYAIYEIGSGH